MNNGLEEKVSASEIVSVAGMSNRPEFYSGNGARYEYLNDAILEKIYQGIFRELGVGAAIAYVHMVADTPILKPTDFLLNLYRLEGHNWKWDKSLLSDQKGVDVGPDSKDSARVAIGLTTIGNTLGNSEVDDTEYIRRKFLLRHGINTRSNQNSKYGIRHGNFLNRERDPDEEWYLDGFKPSHF
jgi:hypothetical protein